MSWIVMASLPVTFAATRYLRCANFHFSPFRSVKTRRLAW
jgi:hypothetical protein